MSEFFYRMFGMVVFLSINLCVGLPKVFDVACFEEMDRELANSKMTITKRTIAMSSLTSKKIINSEVTKTTSFKNTISNMHRLHSETKSNFIPSIEPKRLKLTPETKNHNSLY